MLAALLIVAGGGCKRTPAGQTAEGTLQLFRNSLVNGTPPLEKVADVRIMTEAEVLHELNTVERTTGIPPREETLRSRLAHEQANMRATVVFAGVAPMLREGHCEKIGDAQMPDPLKQTPEPGRSWPAAVLALQHSVARRLTNAFAGDYRCDGGPSFRAVFVRAVPEGTLRVGYIGPAGRP